ncbi:MAG: hypothetical protein JWL68_615 [Actinomycetia bacterium]|nr:hypothetical protein [Actinomycetes bacterium]
MPFFAGSYLAVWALAGVVVYAAYRPHGTLAAGTVVIAAVVYDVTPVKRHFRRRWREATGSGFTFGLCCAGSSLGLVAMLVALGVMRITWMAVIALLVLAQKLLPGKTAIDLPLSLAVAGLGAMIVITPSWFLGSARRCEPSPVTSARPRCCGKKKDKKRKTNNDQSQDRDT